MAATCSSVWPTRLRQGRPVLRADVTVTFTYTWPDLSTEAACYQDLLLASTHKTCSFAETRRFAGVGRGHGWGGGDSVRAAPPAAGGARRPHARPTTELCRCEPRQ